MAKQSRAEFVQSTVTATLSHYLAKYGVPTHTVEDAHRRCLEDAEKLADQVFGKTLDVEYEVVSESRHTPVRITNNRSSANRSSAAPIAPIVPSNGRRSNLVRHPTMGYYNPLHDPYPSITRRTKHH